ncbi:FRG domain-containing protein [uncultured Fibrobacter sp.]|uniref:FRG domain-containing protein n=1 Tax=uncultured Fibrobacter sp. TaxID=261512 RepID=UPI0025948FAA|nr:FRG domain-containing protein [uncultured Fibrobacter sp.]
MRVPAFKTIEEKRNAYQYRQVFQFQDLLEVFNEWRSSNFYFRGQADGSWKIYSSLQREWITKELNERFSFYANYCESFLKFTGNRYRPFINRYCKVITDVSIFSTVQHYGAPTPFIDWTSNPLVALYFASLGNDLCIGDETSSFVSIYGISVGEGPSTPNNDLTRFSDLVANHKNQMDEVRGEWGNILGSDYSEIIRYSVWKALVLWMEEAEEEFMQIANPRSDLQNGAFIYNSEPEKSLDEIFTGKTLESFGNTEEATNGAEVLFLPKIHCLDIHKSVLPQIRKYLQECNYDKRSLGLCGDNWGQNLYQDFLAHI